MTTTVLHALAVPTFGTLAVVGLGHLAHHELHGASLASAFGWGKVHSRVLAILHAVGELTLGLAGLAALAWDATSTFMLVMTALTTALYLMYILHHWRANIRSQDCGCSPTRHEIADYRTMTRVALLALTSCGMVALLIVTGPSGHAEYRHLEAGLGVAIGTTIAPIIWQLPKMLPVAPTG